MAIRCYPNVQVEEKPSIKEVWQEAYGKSSWEEVVDKLGVPQPPVTRKLVYDVTDFQKFLWDDYKEENDTAREVEFEGKKKFEAFNIFVEELYHRFYSRKEKRLDPPAEASEWCQKLHKEIENLPEFKALRDRCAGKDWWAGSSTTCIAKAIMNALDPDQQQVKDIQAELTSKEMLEELKKNAKDDAQKQKIQDQIDNLQKQIDKAKKAGQQASQNINGSDVRNAIRQAGKQANEDLSDLDAASDLMGTIAGTQEGTGTQVIKPPKRLMDLLKDSKRFRRIIDMIGRMQRLALTKQREKARKGTNEISGISTGNNLSRLLPTELMNLADETTELLFASKMYENSLLEYYLQENPVKHKGPIVVLLDTSYSMKNGPDEWAIGVTMGVAAIAAKQKRSLAIVCFDSKTRDEFFFKKNELPEPDKVIEVLNIPFSGGGTNFEESIMRGVFIVKEEDDWKDADLLMVTDGQDYVSDNWLEGYRKQKEELGFRMMSVLVGRDTSKRENEKFSDLVIHINDVVNNGKEIEEIFKEL